MKKNSRQDHDGVFYEPQDQAKQAQKKKPTGIPKKKYKSQYATFLISTLVIGVLVFIAVIAITVSYVSKNNPVSPGLKGDQKIPEPTAPMTTDLVGDIDREDVSVTGILHFINRETDRLEIYDFKDQKRYNLSYANTSILKDKYGKSLLFSQLRRGDIVDVLVDPKTSTLKSLNMNPLAWETKRTDKVQIDVKNHTVSTGSKFYSFDDQIIVLYHEEPYDMAKIRPVDHVTLKGINNQLLFLQVDQGHGTIALENKDQIKDGTFEIDSDYYIELAQFKDGLEVLEGTHQILVNGSNIDLFAKTIEVIPGEKNIIDLSEAQLKSGALSVRVNQQNYTLFVDDNMVSTAEPTILKYGTYKVRVEKDGYLPWETTVEIKKSMVELSATLEKEINLGKINVITDIEGAEVYVDNAYIGTSPTSTNVTYGVHTILVKKSGYREINAPVDLQQPVHNYHVTLTPKEAEVYPYDQTTVDTPVTMPDNQ